MNFFKFKIEKGISYSPNWHGTMPRCPKDVKVLLYNDIDGFGIAQTEDTFIPKEVCIITKTEAMKILAAAQDIDGIFFGTKLDARWDVKEVCYR